MPDLFLSRREVGPGNYSSRKNSTGRVRGLALGGQRTVSDHLDRAVERMASLEIVLEGQSSR